MKDISVNGRSRMVPQSLEELSQDELLKLIRLISEGRDELYIKLKFVCDYWKIPVNRINRMGRQIEKAGNLLQKVAMSEMQMDLLSKLYLLSEQFSFLIKDKKLQKNPVPSIRFAWWRLIRPLVGPSDGLKNLTIWEFAVAERMLENYAHTEEQTYLDQLLAVLYRPVSPLHWFVSMFVWKHDLRVRFNDETITRRLKLIEKVPEEKKVAIAMFFSSVRDGFKDPERFPHIYNNTQKKKSAAKSLSWADVIMEMSGEIPGSEEKTGRVNLYTFLYRLELNAIKAEQMEKELEKLRK